MDTYNNKKYNLIFKKFLQFIEAKYTWTWIYLKASFLSHLLFPKYIIHIQLSLPMWDLVQYLHQLMSGPALSKSLFTYTQTLQKSPEQD